MVVRTIGPQWRGIIGGAAWPKELGEARGRGPGPWIENGGEKEAGSGRLGVELKQGQIV